MIFYKKPQKVGANISHAFDLHIILIYIAMGELNINFTKFRSPVFKRFFHLYFLNSLTKQSQFFLLCTGNCKLAE